MKILLLTKTTPWCYLVREVLDRSEHDVCTVTDLGPDYPRQAYASYSQQRMIRQDEWRGDLIISYLYPRVLTATELGRAPRAINFHPGTYWQRGFAPYSWAIYEQAEDYESALHYGVTVHEMTPHVDSGPILRAETFGASPAASVYDLQQKTMKQMFRIFMLFLEKDFSVPLQGSRPWSWSDGVKTKEDFENLRLIPADADPWEIERRIRACRYPGQPGAYFEGEVG